MLPPSSATPPSATGALSPDLGACRTPPQPLLLQHATPLRKLLRWGLGSDSFVRGMRVVDFSQHWKNVLYCVWC